MQCEEEHCKQRLVTSSSSDAIAERPYDVLLTGRS